MTAKLGQDSCLYTESWPISVTSVHAPRFRIPYVLRENSVVSQAIWFTAPEGTRSNTVPAT